MIPNSIVTNNDKIVANTASASIVNGSHRNNEIAMATNARTYAIVIAIFCFISNCNINIFIPFDTVFTTSYG